MAHFLVVANQTLGGEQLVDALAERVDAGPCSLQFVVPVTDAEGTHQWDYPPIDRVIPDAHRIARTLAEARLEHELARLSGSGVEASGEVVDTGVVDRVKELLAERPFDEIVVSTLPRRLSRWLVTDLPHRISRLSEVPVAHVEGHAGPSV
jgi:GABA permease